jgi:hypothetical protein
VREEVVCDPASPDLCHYERAIGVWVITRGCITLINKKISAYGIVFSYGFLNGRIRNGYFNLAIAFEQR